MPVQCTARDRTLTATISGEVDHHGARVIMEELDRQIGVTLPRQVTLDLGGVTFMDSSGIAVLLRARRETERLGGGVTVTNVPEQADKVLRMAGLHRLLKFE